MSYIIITMYISLFLSVFRLLCFSISPSYTRRCSFSSAFLSLSLRLPSVAIMHFSSSDLRTVPRSQSLPIKMAIHPSAGDDRPTLYFFLSLFTSSSSLPVSFYLSLTLSLPLSVAVTLPSTYLSFSLSRYPSLFIALSLSFALFVFLSLSLPSPTSLSVSVSLSLFFSRCISVFLCLLH